MSTSKVDPFVQKIIWTLVSAGLGIVGLKLAPGTSLETLLLVLAGGGVGGAWIPQPNRKP